MSGLCQQRKLHQLTKRKSRPKAALQFKLMSSKASQYLADAGCKHESGNGLAAGLRESLVWVRFAGCRSADRPAGSP